MRDALSRRAMLRGLGASLAVVVLPAPARSLLEDAARPCAGDRSRVVARRVPGDDPGGLATALGAVVDAVGDLAWLARRDHVLVQVVEIVARRRLAATRAAPGAYADGRRPGPSARSWHPASPTR
jgi:hypothetical protein